MIKCVHNGNTVRFSIPVIGRDCSYTKLPGLEWNAKRLSDITLNLEALGLHKYWKILFQPNVTLYHIYLKFIGKMR